MFVFCEIPNVLYSITWAHQICVYDDHCRTSTVRINEEAERILSKPVIKKEPFTPHMLLKFVQMFGKIGKNLINLRFVSMFLLGYFGFLRYSELANLIQSDIRIFQERLEFFIKKSKTDKFKEGAW